MLAFGGGFDQPDHLGDEASGYRDRFDGALRRDLGIGAGLVIGNGLQVVREAEKGPQFVIDPCVASDEAMELCKEGASVMCPSCKEKVRVVVKGPPKNQSIVREVTYVNPKGEECFFVAKVLEKK